ncbi:UDP-N-acetylmuramoyl-L-alanine--D-glutamate ligase, partial [bacterium]|nr:UDP-N-acetylmuramoyl-L-alanine--D-glutamate ligase [bacterium]
SEINVPVIGITGTNGKSTTTSLIGHLINSSGLKACVAGNIGIPLLDKIEEAKTADYVVLELSSFQLESIPSLKTKVAVWLNVTPDHLDWHKDLEEYAQAKAKIVKSVTNTGWCVYSLDDQIVMNHVEKFNCNKVGFSLKKKLKKGAYLDNEDIVICLSNGGVDKISLGNYSLVGLHNKENALASILTAKLIGLNSFDIERALKSFEGLKHRLQFVRDIDGVKYFNDSKGTNIGAVIMSLAGFDRDVVLILGGQSKNVSFKELRDHVKNKVKALILIGEAKDEIRSDLDGAAKMYNANDMAEAVKLSKEITSSGDTVLLSPACASFDMFKNYAHRGDVFVELVNGL